MLYIFHTVPISSKYKSTFQKFINIIILSPSSSYSPKVPLSRLICTFENGGIDHSNIKSIAKAYSAKFIFDIFNNKVENWQIRAIHRDILMIVRYNLMYNPEFSKLNFKFMVECNLTYLLSLNLITKLFKKKPPLSPLDRISAFSYRAIKFFKLIGLIKNDFDYFFNVNMIPNLTDCKLYSQLMTEPLYFNELFKDNNKVISLFDSDPCFFFLKEIWNPHSKTICLPTHFSHKCHFFCKDGLECYIFWTSVLFKYLPFLLYCNNGGVLMVEDSFENHQSILSDCFKVEFSKDTTSQQVDIHKLTFFFKSLIVNKENILLIKGVVNYTKFWRNNDSTQLIDFNLSFWKSCFENISDLSLSKFVRDAYFRLLHRIYIPFAINSGNESIYLFCKTCLTIRFCTDHAIFECPIKKAF